MPSSADTINTKSSLGRNATPIAVIEAARYVLGGCIALDPASDPVINQDVQAEKIYTVEQDGFSQHWKADTCWLNPPGRTLSQNKQVKGVKWIRKLYHHWKAGDIQDAIALCYRGGSVGGLGIEILQLPLCLTASGAPLVSGSGRISFDLITGSNHREPATSNTQSSVLVLFTKNQLVLQRFQERFTQFGVVRV